MIKLKFNSLSPLNDPDYLKIKGKIQRILFKSKYYILVVSDP